MYGHKREIFYASDAHVLNVHSASVLENVALLSHTSVIDNAPSTLKALVERLVETHFTVIFIAVERVLAAVDDQRDRGVAGDIDRRAQHV